MTDAAEKGVATTSAEDLVGAFPGTREVVALAELDPVGSPAAVNNVVASVGPHHVVTGSRRLR